jgi:acyl-coenzyme A synthetase/AMP-(fatty) acid ligase
LAWRFRPDYVLVDCQGWPAAEAVATLACMRIGRPFVPVSCLEMHQADRMTAVVDMLMKKGKSYDDHDDGSNNNNNNFPSIVAVTTCDNDLDPILAVFQQANVHRILYLNRVTGALQEQFQVPDKLPLPFPLSRIPNNNDDDMYVLFTSGTSSATPKAVVGSRQATWRRLDWFRSTFESSPRIGRRTKLTFVDGVTELWGSLLDHRSLLVAVAPERLQAEGIVCLLQSPMECSQLLLLPSQLHQLLILSPVFSCLERLIVSGEPCPFNVLEKFQSLYPRAQVINLYGQTETTGDCAYAILSDLGKDAVVDSVVAVGKPIGSTTIITKRESDNQLIISGEQVSNGYLGDDDDVAPFKSFATGDTGFCRNGIWYVQGRSDDVIKIDGKWTCPSEMEAAFEKAYQVEGGSSVVATFLDDSKAYIICNNAEACQAFSREGFHSMGIPWNLVPQAVIFCHEIPKSTSGAGKVNRAAAKDIARSHQDPSRKQVVQARSMESKGTDDFHDCVVSALGGVEGEKIDMNRSFVELGGDSGKSITLLYILQQRGFGGLTAVDILMVDNLNGLQSIQKGELPSKRRRTEDVLLSMPFSPLPATESDDKVHRYIDLKACVDSSPTIIGSTLYVACQGGIVLKVDSTSGEVLSHCHLNGWMIQADVLALGESIIVCAYSRSGKGMVLSLSGDLTKEYWRIPFDESIKSNPRLIKEKLWVVAGNTINILQASTGEKTDLTVELPSPVIASPVVIERQDGVHLVYASCDWESCLMLVDQKGGVSKHLEYTIGPVHQDNIAIVRGTQIVVADSYGALHHVDIETMEISKTIKLSNYPLAAPLVMADSSIVVGGYDGTVFCVKDDKVLWECGCTASICSKVVCALDESHVIACTTAGDIVRISRAGRIEWKYRVPAEIWSSPKIISPSSVCFGARDSRLHFVAMK